MKHLIYCTVLLLTSSASADGVWLPVYSYERSSSPLHVRTFSDRQLKEWRFPASYTGHRSVCWLPGATTNMAFVAWAGGDEWQPGAPFGFTPAASPSNTQAIALTRTLAISPRMSIWGETSDRVVWRGGEAFTTNKLIEVDVASLPASTRVRVVRFAVDGLPVWKVNTDPEVIFDKTFSRDVRGFIHEGDFLADGALDIDWDNLESGVYNNIDVASAGCNVTNMTYAVVLGDGDIEYYSDQDNVHRVYAHPHCVTRRFELTHTPPTAVSCTTNASGAAFAWRIDGEDKWASAYGTTYTAFRIRVYNGDTVLHDSGICRMPPANIERVYKWHCPQEWMSNFGSWSTWRVFTYNSRFKTDDVGSSPLTL